MKYISAACKSDKGRIRGNNEDNFYFRGVFLPEQHSEDNGLRAEEMTTENRLDYCVFDGMGGEESGEIASFTAAEAMSKYLEKTRLDSHKKIESMVDELNLKVCAESEKLDFGRMGSTMAGLSFFEDQAYVYNLGDSRIFRLRDGALKQLSVDHVEKRPTGKKAKLTQHLGVFPDELKLEPTVLKCELKDGDRFLICSDGVTDMITEDMIKDILLKKQDVSASCNEIVEEALEHGGKDNTTAIVIDVSSTPVPAVLKKSGKLKKMGIAAGLVLAVLLLSVVGLGKLLRQEKPVLLLDHIEVIEGTTKEVGIINKHQLDLDKLEYTSEDTDIATVDEDGIVTGVTPGKVKIEIRYRRTKKVLTVNVIEDTVKEIEVGNEPSVSEYPLYPPEKEHELNLEGFTVNAVYDSGKKEELSLEDLEISDVDFTSEGIKKVTVKYNDFTTEFEVKVVKKLTGVRIAKYPDRMEYEFGEKIDITGLELELSYSNGERKMMKDISKITVAPSEAKEPGKMRVTLSYEGKNIILDVDVIEKPESDKTDKN